MVAGDILVRDLVGDLVVKPDSLGIRFSKLLGRRMFLKYEGNKRPSDEFNPNSYRWVKNIIQFPEPTDGGGIRVDISIDVENVYYGFNQDNLGDVLIRSWLIGPLLASLTTKDSDYVVGFVQYRATASFEGYSKKVVGIGRGAAAGSVLELSRMEALTVASERALEDSIFMLLRNMNRSLKVKGGYGVEYADWEDYKKKTEEILRGNGE